MFESYWYLGMNRVKKKIHFTKITKKNKFKAMIQLCRFTQKKKRKARPWRRHNKLSSPFTHQIESMKGKNCIPITWLVLSTLLNSQTSLTFLKLNRKGNRPQQQIASHFHLTIISKTIFDDHQVRAPLCRQSQGKM